MLAEDTESNTFSGCFQTTINASDLTIRQITAAAIVIIKLRLYTAWEKKKLLTVLLVTWMMFN